MAGRFILLLLSLVVLVNGDDCDPSCAVLAPGTTLAHPYDCSKYIYCLTGGAMIEADCPEGEQFDMVEIKCTTGEVTCLECPPKGLCSYTCPADDTGAENQFIPDYNDCSIYHLCSNGEQLELLCTGNTPYFSDTTKTCTDDRSQCCDPCATYCQEGDGRIPDPTDCKSFYICTEVGVPGGGSLTCNIGNFDPTIESCSKNATCYQPCGPTQPTNTPKPPTQTTTTTPPIDGDCRTTWLCEAYGYFPACTNRCSPMFFHCELGSTGNQAITELCTGGRLLDPDTMICVEPEDCGYPPWPFRH